MSKSSQEDSDEMPKSVFQADFLPLGSIRFEKTFKSSRGSTKSSSKHCKDSSINAKVYAIRLNKILNKENKKLRSAVRKTLNIDNLHDIVHSIVALYDNCLPDIGATHIYDCICARKAYTIAIFRDDETEVKINGSDEENGKKESDYDEENDCLDAINIEYPDSIFAELFSDEASENDEDSDSTEDFTLGIKSFIEKYKEDKVNNCAKIPLKRLMGCCTLERVNTFQHPGQDEWVLVLQLMSVMKKYRGFGVGKYMVNLIKNTQLVSDYDAIVTSSDSEAVHFYEKFGFDDNPVLNAKYKAIGDSWTNTTRMCFIPPYMRQSSKRSSMETIEELTQIEEDFKKWNKTIFSAYQFQAQIFAKLKQEIMTLKVKLYSQESVISDLQLKNEIYERENRLLKNKLKRFSGDDSSQFSTSSAENNDEDEIEVLLKELRLRSGLLSKDSKNDELKFINSLKSSMRFDYLAESLLVKSVKLAHVNDDYVREYKAVKEQFETIVGASNNSSLVAQLFVTLINKPGCFATDSGDIKLEKEEEKFYEDILRNGFDKKKHFIKDSFGYGVYLSHYSNVCAEDKYVLIVEAVIGNCETVVKVDYDRMKPNNGFDSIVTPGCKRSSAELYENDKIKNDFSVKNQEFVIFNCKQILPLALINCDFK